MRLLFLLTFIVFSLFASAQSFEKSLSIGVTPLYSYRVLSNDTAESYADSIISERNSYEYPIFSYGFFTSYNKKIKEKLYLEGKLRYKRLGFGTDIKLDSLRLRQPNDPFISSSIEFIDVFHFVSLSFNGYYSFHKNKSLNFYGIGGIGFDYMISHYIKRENLPNFNEPDFLFSRRAFNMSGNIGLGTSYIINENLAFNSNLLYSITLFNVNTNPIRARLMFLGLDLGVSYRLK